MNGLDIPRHGPRGPEANRAEVEAWDVADLPPAFEVACHVLLRENEQALAVLRELLAEGPIIRPA
jgi:hypothetical protein